MTTEEIIQTIIAAGRARKLLWIVAREADGSIEPRADSTPQMTAE